MSSVARQVARYGVVVLVTTLVGVGAVTAGALYVQARRSIDTALLAAATQGVAEPGWQAEHVRAPVRTFRVEPGDPRVPAELAARALHGERPVWLDHGRVRMLLLPFEIEGGHREVHGLVAATAPRVTLVGAVGPFALLYGLVAVVGAALASAALRRGVRQAFVPIDRAREAAARIGARDDRLPEDGPDEVLGLIRAINEALERRDVAFRAQSRFTAEAAHELRTPVAVMLGELDVALRRERSASAYREVLVSTREEVERLRRLVAGLTVLARLDAGHAEAGREPVRAREIAHEASTSERAAIEDAGGTLEVAIDDDVELEVNRDLAVVAVANLLRNAARHAPGTPVRLTVRGARFVVDDGGEGLSESDRDAVFARFARGGRARAGGDGLGLGLPLAREIARRHGGGCSLAASPLGGLRAELWFGDGSRGV